MATAKTLAGAIYRATVPEMIRQARWTVKNDVRAIFRDSTPTIETMEYEAYWDKKEREGALWLSYRELVGICADRLPDKARILDVGCGSGILLRELKRLKLVEELGIDVSSKAVSLAKRDGINARVFDVTKDDITQLGRFDVATVFEVLEHIPNPENLLITLKRCTPLIFVSIPNTGYYLHRARLLCGRFPRQWIQHPGEHLRFWTLRDFKSMTDHLGFKVEEIIPIRGRVSLAKYFPSLFAEALFFVLRPA